MKRILSVFLVLASLVLMIPAPQVSAQANSVDSNIIYLEDGGYITVEVNDSSNMARATVSKSKIYTRYSSTDEMQWKVTLSGTFTYDGITASCTSNSCSVTIYKNDWYTDSKTSWKNANSAYATVVMARKSLGVTVSRETINLTLTCDRYGKVS